MGESLGLLKSYLLLVVCISTRPKITNNQQFLHSTYCNPWDDRQKDEEQKNYKN
jgi:hypothetical protein